MPHDGFADADASMAFPNWRRSMIRVMAGAFVCALLATCIQAAEPAEWMTVYSDAGRTYFDLEAQRYPIRKTFRQAYSFIDGYAVVDVDFGENRALFGVIDVSGNLKIGPQFLRLDNLGGGRFLCQKAEDRKYGILSNGGVFKPIDVDHIAYFWGEGLVPAQLTGKWGYLNLEGHWAIPPIFVDASTFSVDGYASVKRKTGAWDFIDKTGKVVLETKYARCGEFSEGLASFQDAEGKFGYIDLKGEVVIPAAYEIAGDFARGLAVVRLVDRQVLTLIDHKGSTRLRLNAKDVIWRPGFAESVIWFRDVDGKWGAIDMHGKTLVKPQYSEVVPTFHGTVIIYRDGAGNAVAGEYDCRTAAWIHEVKPLPSFSRPAK